MKLPIRRKLLSFALCSALTLPGIHATADQFLHLQMHSEPGDYIGQGRDWDVLYLDSNTAFFNVDLQARGSNAQPTYLTFNVMQLPVSTHYLLAQFGTNQLGHELRPGTYLDAMRAPFADPGHPGLDISFEHRGCNTLTGQFTIDDIRYHDSGGIWYLDYFEASFEQHCEGAEPALFGSIVYSATAIPEPVSGAVIALGLIGICLGSRPSRN